MSRVCPADLYVLEKLPHQLHVYPPTHRKYTPVALYRRLWGRHAPATFAHGSQVTLQQGVHGQDLLLVPARTFIAALASVYSKVHMARGLGLDVSRYVH